MAALPALRRFAVALTRDANRADDLVQDTVVRAWDKAEGFKPGTTLQAWLFTILRNLFYSEQRKREVEDVDGMHAGRLATLPA
ncbi:sigma factor [Methylobacterium sp. WL6]|uniref:sigma factor n=1 Tax=Methylobacterium sp. WL6 TaxID=2603901 RepID=UPI0032B1ACF9